MVKSAIAKDVVSILAQDHVAFAFRAEEFAKAHIDEVLQAAQVGATAATLAAILAGQVRKVVLIESVERLLEKTTRDAFSDLMGLVADDPELRVILTCRDYSLELVRASFLQPERITHAMVRVPELMDAELDEIRLAVPVLAYPLANDALRDILRNPYFLDQALHIAWSADRPIPDSEREFRALFWRQIVRQEQYTAGGMAQRRERAFSEIAVRRAQALTDYVVCDDLDAEAIAALRRDSLIISPDEQPSRLATAHDVLEDWAILRWIEQRADGERSFKDLSDAIGTHPAIRRSYRTWLAELLDRDPPAADRVFRAALADREISAQFRDDTLVSLLKAPSAPEFVTRHETELLADDQAILKRVIHLLRVACVRLPDWLAGSKEYGSVLNVPDGPAWAAVLSLVHRHLDDFSADDEPALLGLIEDAVRSVSWRTPNLQGAESVAGIAHRLLPGRDHYGAEKWRKRVLRVLAKIPLADPTAFERVLRGQPPSPRGRDVNADDLREILFCTSEGSAAARDLPVLFVSVTKEHLLATDADVGKSNYASWSPGVGMSFGIREGTISDFFPPSAYRGPWITLLRHHPRLALDFFIDVFNHSADWYAHPRPSKALESAWEVELTFADGTMRTHWCSPRLWNLYRGTSVGPYALESLLMAFEKWLLELAALDSKQLDAVLVDTLRRSDSAMLAAVVASVATGHPQLSGEALLVLLSAPDYIRLDQRRMGTDSMGSSLSDLLPDPRAENVVYTQERREADGLPHRRRHIEAAVANLQLGPLAPRAHAILDLHRAALPQTPEPDSSDLWWRLALHRMDLRKYTVSTETEEQAPEPGTPGNQLTRTSVRLEPQALAPDMQAVVDENATRFGAVEERLGVFGWGLQTFERKSAGDIAVRWRSVLANARKIDREFEYPDGSRNGPGVVAAVCVRDHWDQLSSDDREWCIKVVCSEIARGSDAWDGYAGMQRFPMGADGCCASVAPTLFGKTLTERQSESVRRALVLALTHPVEEVRWHAIWGIDSEFWATNGDTAMCSVNAIATEAALVDEAMREEYRRPWDERRAHAEIRAEAAATVRHRFWEKSAISETAFDALDVSEGACAEALSLILAIFGSVPEEPMATSAFERASRALVEWWDAGEDHTRRQERNFELEQTISRLLQQFVMRAAQVSSRTVLQPILDAIGRHPDKIDDFVDGLRVIENRERNTEHFWSLWNLFADGITQAPWVRSLDSDYTFGSPMLSAIFMTRWWKDDVRHWGALEGYAQHVHALFEQLPAVPVVLDEYVRFLYHIGERSLPEAFVRLAAAFRRGDAPAMLARADTVFCLEVLLQRHVYGRPLELKRDADLQDAVLRLLDVLVENGSSAAFRMRDDFVTPGS